jgi:hypothetical protein
MPLNFPNSPSLDQIYTVGSNSWQWDGTVWNAFSSSSVGPAGPTGAAGATGATGSFNTTTKTIDFSKDINKIQFDVFTTNTGVFVLNEATKSDILGLAGSTATIQRTNESIVVVGTVESIEWYKNSNVNAISPTGYFTILMKPPFYNYNTPGTTYTAENIIGLTLERFSGGLGAAPPPNFDPVGITGSVTLVHMEESYAILGVTGQSWVAADTFITCKVLGLTTADHDPEDAILEGVRFEINNIVAGSGFDLIGHAPEGTYGKYKIKCLGQ